MKATNEPYKTIAQNRKAYHEYFIMETYEAGIELVGTEVKSIRGGQVNLKDSFAKIKNEEIFLWNMHVSPYEKGNIFNKDPLRTRKLLLHKEEIRKLMGKTQVEGFTLIPTKIYLKRGNVKVEIGLAKGKQLYDKRADMAKKDVKREIDKKMKEFNRGV